MRPRTASRSANASRNAAARDTNERSRRAEPSKPRTRIARPGTEPSLPELTNPAPADDDGAPSIGENLRRLRSDRALSLDALAQMSGVSRAMLGQIELNRSVPTITVLWRIARALDLPFSALMREPTAEGPAVLRRGNARFLTSADGSFKSRALFPADRQRFVEFYEVRLSPGAVEEASAHPAGTLENIVVAKGTLEVTAGGAPTALAMGDAMQFRADLPHRYHNPGAAESIVYMVITYAQRT